MVNEWTRADLPGVHWHGIHGESERQGAEKALDAVVEHLNAHHPKPEPDRLERQAATIGELQGCFLRVEADAARWRRAHEIVEQERDQARRERDVALRRKGEAFDRAVRAERERDVWKARAEAAEDRTAPAVTRADIEKAVRGQWGGCFDGLTDAVWSLVSGADPAVHVVRESDVAAVEVRLASDGWYADGAWLASADETAEWVRDRATEMVVCAARNEAVARAIEQDAASDPIADAIRDGLNVWGTTDEGVRQIAESIRRAISNDGGENAL